ncbi:hypothetical protein D4764_13G0000060 [Takifugu flavidus]|uniref:Uncharacterized protein n=1 Tax=Takifugu flavidus TaxID=433684 RepID=A0A5C6P6A8_9TELE|nr:hypothetical protein D4764_13G0000060 [Takifugu flavidus]
MAPVKRHAYEAYFKLQAIEYAAENGNRAAARHFNVNESMRLPADYQERVAIFRTYCRDKITVPTGINAEAELVGESDSDDEEEFGMLDIEIAQLFNSDTEDENFDDRRGEERRGEERRGEERRGTEHRNTHKNTLYNGSARPEVIMQLRKAAIPVNKQRGKGGEKQKNYTGIIITSLLDEEEERRGKERRGNHDPVG